MSIEGMLLARAGTHVVSETARNVLLAEASKGCAPDLFQSPVALEPCFAPIGSWRSLLDRSPRSLAVQEPVIATDRLVRLRVWIPTDHELDWRHSERFLKQLSAAAYRIGFEVSGNQNEISFRFLCLDSDVPILAAAFQGEFPGSALSIDSSVRDDDLVPISARFAAVADFFPPPPYSWLLTRPEELGTSPYETFITGLSNLSRDEIGLCQVLFQRVSPQNNWHANVEALRDIEFSMKTLDGVHQVATRYPQPGPSGDPKQMAFELERKAHNDKGFFSVALRLAVAATPERAAQLLRALATFVCLYQFGGRPLSCVTHNDYARHLPHVPLDRMIALGTTHRPGFLLNSWELTGLVHLPPASIAARRRSLPLVLGEKLPPPTIMFAEGTRIGTFTHAGRPIPVHIPTAARTNHVHAIGRPDTGKSLLLEHMALADIAAGTGIAVLDPHGDLVTRLLEHMPAEHAERVIYFSPSDPNWVPLWNPLQLAPGQDPARVADDLAAAFKSFLTGYGDRLDQILRQTFFALLQIPGCTLLDVAQVFRKDSPRGKRLREQIAEIVEGDDPRSFWTEDFKQYGRLDLAPPKHKLGKLLLGGTVALMLSQPTSAFNFRQIMDEGKVFLANLAGLGSEVCEVLGCLMLSQFHQAALSRSDTLLALRRAFHLFIDEAHRFLTDAMEDIIVETRKYNVGLTLAHQYMNQFGQEKKDALASAGSTIIFNLDTRDAGFLSKDLRKLVTVDDLITLKRGEAVVRCGTEITRIKTLGPESMRETFLKDRIIEESRRRYCRRALEIRGALRRRREGLVAFTNLGPCEHHDASEFTYDEFDA